MIGLSCALLVALTVGGVAGAAADSFLRDAKYDNKIAIRGCVIRFDERVEIGDGAYRTVPRIHANESHYCVGVTGIAVNPGNGDLEVRSNTKGPIVSLAVSPDESLTKAGISCGGSGGGGITRIRCYDRAGNAVRADSEFIYGAYNNLWLTWFTWQDD